MMTSAIRFQFSRTALAIFGGNVLQAVALATKSRFSKSAERFREVMRRNFSSKCPAAVLAAHRSHARKRQHRHLPISKLFLIGSDALTNSTKNTSNRYLIGAVFLVN